VITWLLPVIILVHMTYEEISKLRYVTFRQLGIAQKKEYNIHNMTTVLNQEKMIYLDNECSFIDVFL